MKSKVVLSLVLFLFAANALAQTLPLIRLGRGFAAEEQVWLMSVRKDLTPNQGKRYELKQILFQANPERFQAFYIGADGRILYIDKHVSPSTHGKAIVDKLGELGVPRRRQ